MKKLVNLILGLSCAIIGGTGVSLLPFSMPVEDTYASSVTELTVENGVYQIGSADELAFVANKINSGNSLYVSASYCLTNNINLAGKIWTPIGYNSTYSFKGTFNGNGYTISGMATINEALYSSSSYNGLFGYVKNATIYDIVLGSSFNWTTYNENYSGGLIGYADNSTIAAIYDYSSYSGKTIGTLSSSRVYYGGYELRTKTIYSEGDPVESTTAIEDTFTYNGTPTEIGKVVTFDARGGIIRVDDTYYDGRYLIALNSSDEAFSMGKPGFGTEFPTDVYKYGYKGSWGYSSLSEVIADSTSNKYTLRVNWGSEINESITVKEGSSVIGTINVKYAESLENVANSVAALDPNCDLLRAWYKKGEDDVNIYGPVTVKYVNNNRCIDDVATTDRLLSSKINQNYYGYDGTRPTIISTTWQATAINFKIEYDHKNGGDIVSAFTTSPALEYEDELNGLISQGADETFSLYGGTAFTFTINVPTGYSVKVVDLYENNTWSFDGEITNGDLVNLEDYSSTGVSLEEGYYTGTVVCKFENGFTRNKENRKNGLKVYVQRLPYNISYVDGGINYIDSVEITNSTYTKVDTATGKITTYIHESPNLKFIANSNYRLKACEIQNINYTDVTNEKEGNYNWVVNFEKITGFDLTDGKTALIKFTAASRSFNIDFDYVYSEMPKYSATYAKVETGSAGSYSYIYQESEIVEDVKAAIAGTGIYQISYIDSYGKTITVTNVACNQLNFYARVYDSITDGTNTIPANTEVTYTIGATSGTFNITGGGVTINNVKARKIHFYAKTKQIISTIPANTEVIYRSGLSSSAFQSHLDDVGALYITCTGTSYYQISKLYLGTSLDSLDEYELKNLTAESLLVKDTNSAGKYIYANLLNNLNTLSEDVCTFYIRAELAPSEFKYSLNFDITHNGTTYEKSIYDINGSKRDLTLSDATAVRDGDDEKVVKINEQLFNLGESIGYTVTILNKYYVIDYIKIANKDIYLVESSGNTTEHFSYKLEIDDDGVGDVNLDIRIGIRPKTIDVTIDVNQTVIANYNNTGTNISVAEKYFNIGTSDDTTYSNTFNYGENENLTYKELVATHPFTLLGYGVMIDGNIICGNYDSFIDSDENKKITIFNLFGLTSGLEYNEAEFTNKYFAGDAVYGSITLYPVVMQKYYNITLASTDKDEQVGITYNGKSSVTNDDKTTIKYYYQPSSLLEESGYSLSNIYLDNEGTPYAKLNSEYYSFAISSGIVYIDGNQINIVRSGEDSVLLEEYIKAHYLNSENNTAITIYPYVYRISYTITFKYTDLDGEETTKTKEVYCYNENVANNDNTDFTILKQEDLKDSSNSVNYHYGYTLTGWKIDCDVTSTFDSSTFYNGKEFDINYLGTEYKLTQDLVLVALEEAKEVDVVINNNIYNSVSRTVNSDYSQTFASVLNGLTWYDGIALSESRPGYTLIGWVLTKAITNQTISEGEVIANVSGSVYCYYTEGNHDALIARLGSDFEAVCKPIDSTDKFDTLREFAKVTENKLYAYAIWQINNSSEDFYITFDEEEKSFIQKDDEHVSVIEIKKQNFPTDFWTNSIYGTLNLNVYSSKSTGGVYTKIYINDVLNTIICNKTIENKFKASRLSQVLGADSEFASIRYINDNASFMTETGVIFNSFELKDAVYTIRFEVFISDTPVIVEDSIQNEGSILWYDPSPVKNVASLSVELDIFGVSLELTTDKDENIKAVLSEQEKYVDENSYAKRLIEYKTIKTYLDAASIYFKNHPEYDAEGFFIDYSSDWDLIQIIEKITTFYNNSTDKLLFNYDYYKAIDKTGSLEELRNLTPQYTFGQGLNSGYITSFGEEYLLKALTDAEFSYLEYLGYKSLIVLMNQNERFKTNMQEFVENISSSDAAKINESLNNVNSYRKYVNNIINNNIIISVKGYESLEEHLNTELSIVGSKSGESTVYSVKIGETTYTNVELIFGTSEDYKTIKIKKDAFEYTLYMTYMYTEVSKNSFVESIMTSNIDIILDNITLWSLNSTGITLGDLYFGTLTPYNSSSYSLSDEMLAVNADIGNYSNIVWMLDIGSMDEVNFEKNVSMEAESCKKVFDGVSYYYVIDAIELFTKATETTDDNLKTKYGTLNYVYKAPIFELIELEDNYVISDDGVVTFERSVNLDINNDGSEEELTLKFVYTKSTSSYELLVKFSEESGFVAQVNGVWTWDNKNYVFSIINSINVVASSLFDEDRFASICIKSVEGNKNITLDLTEYSNTITITGMSIDDYSIEFAQPAYVGATLMTSVYGTNSDGRIFIGTIVLNGTKDIAIKTTKTISSITYLYELSDNSEEGMYWIGTTENNNETTMLDMLSNLGSIMNYTGTISKAISTKFFISSEVFMLNVANGRTTDTYPKGEPKTETYYAKYKTFNDSSVNLTDELLSTTEGFVDADNIWEIKGFTYADGTTSDDVDASEYRKEIWVKEFKKISLIAVWGMVSDNLEITLVNDGLIELNANKTGNNIEAANCIVSVKGFTDTEWEAKWLVDGVEVDNLTLYGTKENGTYTLIVRVPGVVTTTTYVNFNITPIELALNELPDAVYNATDRHDDYINSITFNGDIKVDDANDGLILNFYGDDSITAVDEIKNVGTYYAKFDYTNAVHGLYTIDQTSSYEFEITKYAQTIAFNQLINKIGFSRYLTDVYNGVNATAQFMTALNELVDLTFTSVDGYTYDSSTEPAKLPLQLSGVYSNYEFTLSGFEEAFEVKSKEGELVVDITGTFKTAYINKNIILKLNYRLVSEGYTWCITAFKEGTSEDLFSCPVTLKRWDTAESKYVNVTGLATDFLDNVVIGSYESMKNVGQYMLTISAEEALTGYPNGISFMANPTYFTIEKKGLTISSSILTKEYDTTDTASWIISVNDEEVVINGKYSNKNVGSEKTITLTCDNENYVITNPNAAGSITKNTSWTIQFENSELRFPFGYITNENKGAKTTYGFAIVNQAGLNLDEEFIISSIAIVGVSETDYLNGYLRAREEAYVVHVEVSSSGFTTTELEFNLFIDKKVVDIEIKNATKYYDGTSDAHASALKKSTIDNTITASGETITSIKFNDSVVKKYYASDFIIDINSEYKEYYEFNITLEKDYYEIKNVIIDLQLDHTAFNFPEDGKAVVGGASEKFTFNENNTISVSALRTGYNFLGWSANKLNLNDGMIEDNDLNKYIKNCVINDNKLEKGSLIGNDDTFKITLYSNWEALTYNVSVVYDDSKTSIQLNGIDTASAIVSYYSLLNITIIPNSNYMVESVILNGNALEIEDISSGDDIKYSAKVNISEESTINITIRYAIVKITKVISEEVKNTFIVSYDELSAYDMDADVTKTGYEVAGWQYNSSDVEKVASKYNIADAIGNVKDGQDFEFTPVWSAKKYNVTFYKELPVIDSYGNYVLSGGIAKQVIYDQLLDMTTINNNDTGSTELDFAITDKVLIGWQTFNGDITFKTEDAYTYAGSLHLFGVWADAKSELTIILNSNGISYTIVENSTTEESAELKEGTDSTYILYLAKEYKISLSLPRGYKYTLSYDNTKINLNYNGTDDIIVEKILANTTLTIDVNPRENTFNLNIKNAILTNVKVAGNNATYISNGNNYTIVVVTGNDVELELQAVLGYILNLEDCVVNGGDPTTTVVDGKINFSDIVCDIEVYIEAIPAQINASYEFGQGVNSITILEYIVTDSGKTLVKTETINNTEEYGDTISGVFTTETGKMLEISINVANGYKDLSLSADNDVVFGLIDINKYRISGYTSDYNIVISVNALEYSTNATMVAIDESNTIITSALNTAVIVDSENTQITIAPHESTIYAKATCAVGYIFEGWYLGVSYSTDNEKITEFNNLISTDINYEIKVNSNVNLIGIFRFIKYDITFVTEGKGCFDYEDEIEYLESIRNLSKEVTHSQEVIITIKPNKGYKLTELIISTTEEDYSITGALGVENYFEVVSFEDNILKVKFYADDVNVKMTFEAKTSTITARTIMVVSDVDILSNTAYFAKVGLATPVVGEDDKYSIGEVKNLNEFAFTTDEEIYICVEVYKGFEFAYISSMQSGKSTAIIELVKEYPSANETMCYIYRISGLNADDEYNTIAARIKANEINLSLVFMNQDGDIVDAGRILAKDTEDFGVIVSGNYSSEVNIIAIAGRQIKIEIYTRFGFKIMKDNPVSLGTGMNKLAPVYSDTLEASKGFVTSYIFTLNGYQEDFNIVINVWAESYQIELNANGEKLTGSELIQDIKFGQLFELSETNIKAIRDYINLNEGYEFAGFYTAQNGTGTKYINNKLEVIKALAESEYIWNGSKYVEAANYNSTTKTFTLYLAWTKLKSNITISVVPDCIKSISPTVAASVVITSIDDTNSWFDVENKFSVDVLYGADIIIKAPKYNNYKFKSWTIWLDDVKQEDIMTETYTKLGGFECKSVKIQANYTVEFGVKAQEGGTAIIRQGDTIINQGEKGYLNPEEEVVLIATPKVGYTFIGWYNSETDEFISNDKECIIIPTNKGLQATYVIAKFIGNDVRVVMDTNYDKVYGNVEYVLYNGEKIIYNTFDAKVGDEIMIYVALTMDFFNNYGVKWNHESVRYAGEYRDSVTNVKYLLYYYKLQGMDVIDNTITLKPVFSEQKFVVNVSIKYNESEDYAIAGEFLSLTEMINNQIFVYYGYPLQIKVKPNTNYKIQSVMVNEIDTLFLDEDGETITISSDKFAYYYLSNTEITLYVVFTEDRWIDSVEELGIKGEGTENNPYLIYNIKELTYIAYKINVALDKDFASANYRVMADISANGKFWVPIGTEENPFTGFFNFNDFSVYGVAIEDKYGEERKQFGGVFGVIGNSGKVIIHDNSKLIIILSTTIPTGCAVAGVSTYFIIRKRRKKLHEKLSNN